MGPYGVTQMSPCGVTHMGPCVETHMGLLSLSLCGTQIGYTLWDCPLGSHKEPMWCSPYGHAQLKLTWDPHTHVTWDTRMSPPRVFVCFFRRLSSLMRHLDVWRIGDVTTLLIQIRHY